MIYIKGFESIVYIKDFSLKKSLYSHSVCEFECLINSEETEEYYSKSGDPIYIDYNDKTIFCGYIHEISVDNFFSSAFVKVIAFSESKRIDIASKFRIFQDPEKTFEKMLDKVKCDFNIKIEDRKIREEKITSPILQNNETDFSFILRMCRNYNLYVVPDDRSSGKKSLIIYSKPEKIPNKLDYKKLISCKMIKKYDCNSDNGSFYDYIQISSNEYMDIGYEIDLSDKYSGTYFIESMELIKEDELYYCKYNLFEDGKYIFPELEGIQGISFEAKVTDNKDPDMQGRVQVEFIDKVFEDCSDKKMWIPNKTQYTGNNVGIIFIPDVNDIVNVVFENESFIVTNSVRKEKIDDRFSNPNNKYIANIFNRSISFTENNLEITSGENYIHMTDDSITFSVSDSCINIEKNQIVISVGENKFIINDSSAELNTKEQINIKTKEINDEIGKDINIRASGDINLKVKKADISSSGIEIKVGTGKFIVR